MNNNDQIKLAIIDFDDTLIKGQSQKMLIDYFYKNKYISLFQYTRILIWFFFFKFNLVSDIKAIFQFAVSSIKNKTIEELVPIFDDFFTEICIPHIYKNSKNLVDFLKSNGFYIVIISTAIDPIISRANKYFNIDEYICTKLNVIDGVYTGEINGLPMFGENKLRALNNFTKNSKYTDTYAFADHATDIPLLSSVKHPIVVNPSKKLWKSAQENNWPMVYLNNNESFQYFKSNTKFQ